MTIVLHVSANELIVVYALFPRSRWLLVLAHHGVQLKSSGRVRNRKVIGSIPDFSSGHHNLFIITNSHVLYEVLYKKHP